jgi:hypothetical protein
MPMLTTDLGQEAHIQERFEQETANHRMRVLHDHGVYRHLRFSELGAWAYGYDLVTWPGHLAISGDCGAYTFARTWDMFNWFSSGEVRISPDYWSGKLVNPDERDGTRRYSRDRFKPRVLEWYMQQSEYEPDEAGSLHQALEDQVFSWGAPDSAHEAIERLRDFKHGNIQIYEPWDFDFNEWDWQYLWCCWAIVQGIAQYNWSKGWK